MLAQIVGTVWLIVALGFAVSPMPLFAIPSALLGALFYWLAERIEQ